MYTRIAAARDFTAHKRGGGGKENIHKKWSSVQRGKGPLEPLETWGLVPTKFWFIRSPFFKIRQSTIYYDGSLVSWDK